MIDYEGGTTPGSWTALRTPTLIREIVSRERCVLRQRLDGGNGRRSVARERRHV